MIEPTELKNTKNKCQIGPCNPKFLDKHIQTSFAPPPSKGLFRPKFLPSGPDPSLSKFPDHKAAYFLEGYVRGGRLTNYKANGWNLKEKKQKEKEEHWLKTHIFVGFSR